MPIPRSPDFQLIDHKVSDKRPSDKTMPNAGMAEKVQSPVARITHLPQSEQRNTMLVCKY